MRLFSVEQHQACLRHRECSVCVSAHPSDYFRPEKSTVLHFIPERDDPARIIAGYRDALPAGSYLALSHLTDETAPPNLHAQVRRCIDTYQDSASPLIARSRDTLRGWLDGLPLIAPGITVANLWHPDDRPDHGPDHDLVIAGLAHIPA